MKGKSLNNWRPILIKKMTKANKEFGNGCSGVMQVDAALSMLTYQRQPDWLRRSHYRSLASGISKPVKYINKLNK